MSEARMRSIKEIETELKSNYAELVAISYKRNKAMLDLTLKYAVCDQVDLIRAHPDVVNKALETLNPIHSALYAKVRELKREHTEVSKMMDFIESYNNNVSAMKESWDWIVETQEMIEELTNRINQASNCDQAAKDEATEDLDGIKCYLCKKHEKLKVAISYLEEQRANDDTE
jgi:hypothetical protein